MSGATDATYALEGLVEAVRLILDDHDGTLAVVLVEVPAPAPLSVLSAQLTALRESLGASLPAGAELHVVGEGPGSDALLASLNSSRDVYARFCPLILLLVEDGPGTQSVFRRAPDLVSGLTQLLKLERRADDLDEDALRTKLAAYNTKTWGRLGLGGLVPHNPTLKHFELREVFVSRHALPPASDDRPLVLLVGEPGSGKSVLLRATALGLTGEIPDGRMPFLLALSAWSSEAARHLTPLGEWVAQQIAQALSVNAVAPGRVFPHLWLLLDGLDEVRTLADRRRVLDDAQALVRAHPGLAIVVSGRELVLEQLLAHHRAEWRALRIGPFDLVHAKDLLERTIRAWHGVANGAPLPAEAATRMARATASAAFGALSRSPLLVVFYAVLMELDREPPSHAPALYNALVEMLIVNWQAVRAGGGPRLSRADAYRTLGPLGWGLVESEVVGLTKDELLARIESADALTAPGAERADAARRRLAQLSEDSALLMMEGGRWRFHHLTIAEFLAARAALLSPSVAQAIADEPYLPRRQQTVAFAVSLVVDIEPRDDLAALWLDALATQAKRRGVYDAKIPSTLAAVLSHARGLPAGRRDALCAHLVRIAFRQKLTPWQRDLAVGAWSAADAEGGTTESQREALAADGIARSSVGDALRRLPDWGAPPQMVRWLATDARVGHVWLRAWLVDADPAVRVLAWRVGAFCKGFDWSRLHTQDPEVADQLKRESDVLQFIFPWAADAMPAPLEEALGGRPT